MKPYYHDERAGITIYHGDCREILPTLKADLVMADPPYGVGLEYASYDDSLDGAKSMYVDFIQKAMASAPIVLTTVGCYALELFLYSQLPPKWRLCWRKGITSRPSAVGFTDWEPIFVYGENVHRHAHDLFTVQPERMGSFGHPCPKPIGFALWLVDKFSDKGATVIDPFMGSGTTLRAAKDLGRKAIGIEIEEKYCEIAVKRLAQGVMFT
jgi:site-specific DNA-methyltransferase (adenine-specific)